MRESGLALWDVIAAIAIAALFVGASATAMRAAARTLDGARQRWVVQATARNALEAELALPCAGPTVCSRDYDCRMSRTPTGVPGIYRIDSIVNKVRPAGLDIGVRFSVLVARQSPCQR